MDRKHGDALFADRQKVGSVPNGQHMRRGYMMVCPVNEITKTDPAGPSVERSDRHHSIASKTHGLRDGTKRSRREWEHRKVANAKPGQIVHHIDGNPLNNDRENLHVFNSPADHALAHRSLEMIAFGLIARGLVQFDPESGRYLPTESLDLSTSCS